MSRPHVIKAKRRGLTLLIDTARARRLEMQAREALAMLLAATPEDDRPGLARAIVQEAVRLDACVRGEDDARAWAAKQARAA